MKPENLKETLDSHKKWLLGKPDGTKADLQYAYLQYANLRDANLRDADLRRANLQGADLRRANLRGAYLRDADLRRANLRGADLRDANLRNANLRDAYLPHFQIPAGDLIAYKKLANGIIATLKIESHSERTASLVGRKCRCSGALVLALSNGTSGRDDRGTGTKYNIGEYVYPDKYDDDIRVECTHGIHFFLTRKEAEEY